MMRAVGDNALVEGIGELKLVGARGVLEVWDNISVWSPPREPEVQPFTGEIFSCVSLAHPPRLALFRATGRRVQMRIADIEEAWVELIDPSTGAVQLRVDVAPTVTGLNGFDPSGTVLLAHGLEGMTRIDDSGVARSFGDRDDVVFNVAHVAESKTALGWRTVGAGGSGRGRSETSRVVLVDVELGVVRWSATAAVRAAVPDQRGTRAVVLEQDESRAYRFVFWDLTSGTRSGDSIPVSLPSVPERSTAHAAVGMWATPDLDRVALLVDDGTLVTIELRRGRGWANTRAPLTRDIVVHVERNRVLQPGLGVYLRTLAGELVKTAGKATKMCFAGSGAGCVLIGGAVYTLDETGSHLIDGPADLVDIATHPTGVIALDANDRAHVVEIGS